MNPSSSFARMLSWFVVTLTIVLSYEASAAEARRPNIIFLLTDDQRFDSMGCVGNPIVQTPHLDRLAEGGVLFRNSFATTSICAVSRASFLTGQYERRHGVGDFRTPLGPEAFAKTYPVLLRRAGYRTGFVGKWGVGGELPKEEFDYWDGFAGQGRYFYQGDPVHMTQKLEQSAAQFLSSANADQPFCLAVSFKAAHVQDRDPRPFQPDPRYESLYADVRIPAVDKSDPKYFEALPEFLRNSEGRVRWGRRFVTPEMYQNSVKDYYRLVTGIDRVVGSISTQLAQQGLADNTVIIFTSDHGFFLGEYGLAGKWLMYEESIRTPLIIHDPRQPESVRGKRRDEMVLNIDIAPTILQLAGVDIPKSVQGVSLLPLVEGKTVPWRDDWFYEHRFAHPRIPKSEGVRTHRYKYIRYIESNPLHEELYDLKKDPAEKVNLVGNAKYEMELAKLRRQWQAYREELR